MTFQDVPPDQWRVRNGAKVTEIPPEACPNGHELKPGTVVAWLPCSCAGGNGHRTYECQACGVVIYRPAHAPGSPTAANFPLSR